MLLGLENNDFKRKPSCVSQRLETLYSPVPGSICSGVPVATGGQWGGCLSAYLLALLYLSPPWTAVCLSLPFLIREVAFAAAVVNGTTLCLPADLLGLLS